MKQNYNITDDEFYIGKPINDYQTKAKREKHGRKYITKTHTDDKNLLNQFVKLYDSLLNQTNKLEKTLCRINKTITQDSLLYCGIDSKIWSIVEKQYPDRLIVEIDGDLFLMGEQVQDTCCLYNAKKIKANMKLSPETYFILEEIVLDPNGEYDHTWYSIKKIENKERRRA